MIEKKKILIIGGVGIILVLGLAVFFVVQKKKTAIVSPIQPPGILEEKEAETLLTYKDEAGFEFKYPENLTIKDISGADQSVYSSLEISSSQHEGKMAIKIVDTLFTSVDAWLKSKEASGAGVAREITLAGMEGAQIQFANPRRLVTIVIDEGIMYFFESLLDEAEYWNKIHNNIVSSFTLTETQTPAPQGGGEEVIYEEEEVIE
ncbi:hypothetical protein HZB97_01400 [Candidatus Gottesmanbacteria bacterium]|nr:hypothetical protein [Candidatus Gottesmanbacteria bacterium]